MRNAFYLNSLKRFYLNKKWVQIKINGLKVSKYDKKNVK